MSVIQTDKDISATEAGGLRALFLDRDGVINVDKGYVHRWEQFEFIPGVVEGMRRFADAGFTIVIVTNQSGIARGYYSEEQFLELTSQVTTHLESLGVSLAATYHCPHHPEGKRPDLAIECTCRKPAPGMLLRARDELQVELRRSVLIGDSRSDIRAARSAGVGRAFLLKATCDSEEPASLEYVIADSIDDCAERLGLPPISAA